MFNKSILIILIASLNLTYANIFCPKSKTLTTAESAPMKDCTSDYSNLDDCFTVRDEANSGFTMLHRDQENEIIKTRYSALLVHGMSGSPYYLKDVAKALFARGINVVAIRLTGHGTLPSDLEKVKLADWMKDTVWGRNLALKYGEQIIYGGYSLGGITVSLDILENKIKPAGVFYISFGIGAEVKYYLSCLPLVNKKYHEMEDFDNEAVRYLKVSYNGACQTTIGSNRVKKWTKRGKHKPYFDFPSLTILTDNDEWVTSLDSSFNFVKDTPADKNNTARVLLFTKDISVEPYADLYTNQVRRVDAPTLSHSFLILSPEETLFTREVNPQFFEIKQELNALLDDIEGK